MDAKQAFYEACAMKEPKFPLDEDDEEGQAGKQSKLNQLAQVIVDEQNFSYVILWVREIGTKGLSASVVEDMAQIVLDFGDIYYMAEWIVYVGDDVVPHSLFKMQAVKLGRVENFLDAWNSITFGGEDYSFEDFYRDLPSEARVGVVV